MDELLQETTMDSPSKKDATPSSPLLVDQKTKGNGVESDEESVDFIPETQLDPIQIKSHTNPLHSSISQDSTHETTKSFIKSHSAASVVWFKPLPKSTYSHMQRKLVHDLRV